MLNQIKNEPVIVTYNIPRIEVYQVTDEELKRIEERCSQVGQDLSFAIAFISFAIAFFITLSTAVLSDLQKVIFIIVSIICCIGFFYTGIRWWNARKTAPSVISCIRSRKDNPQLPEEKQI
jgi:hypothetical protein